MHLCRCDTTDSESRRVFGAIADDNYLVSIRRESFIIRLAEHWGEVNALHPFREGNTRTQRVFFQQNGRGGQPRPRQVHVLRSSLHSVISVRWFVPARWGRRSPGRPASANTPANDGKIAERDTQPCGSGQNAWLRITFSDLGRRRWREAASRRPNTAGALRRSPHDRRLGAKNRAERGWLHPNGDHGARVSVHREERARSQPIQATQRYARLRNVVNSG